MFFFYNYDTSLEVMYTCIQNMINYAIAFPYTSILSERQEHLS